MYIRVTRASYDSSHEAEIETMVRETLIPALKQLPGFRHYHGGLDRQARRLVAISIWDTEEHSQAIASQRAQFEALGMRFDAPETFEATDEV